MDWWKKAKVTRKALVLGTEQGTVGRKTLTPPVLLFPGKVGWEGAIHQWNQFLECFQMIDLCGKNREETHRDLAEIPDAVGNRYFVLEAINVTSGHFLPILKPYLRLPSRTGHEDSF